MDKSRDLEIILQEIEDNINVGDNQQVKLFTDMVAEIKLPNRFYQLSLLTLSLLKNAKQKTTVNDDSIKEQQISRLITHLKYFVSLFEALSSDGELFNLFMASDNIQNSIKLIPRSYFQNQANQLRHFLDEYDDVITSNNFLTRFDPNNLTQKIAEISLLKNQVSNASDIQTVKDGFSEVCALFEMVNFINSLLITKKFNSSIIFEDKTQDLDMVTEVNIYKAENEKLKQQINEMKSTNKKLQLSLKNMKVEMSNYYEIIQNLKNKLDENNFKVTNPLLSENKSKNQLIETLQSENKKLKESISHANQIESSTISLQQKCNLLESQVLSLKKSINDKDDEIKKAKTDLNEVSSQANKIISAYEKKKSEIELMKDNNAKTILALKKASKKIQILKRENELLKNEKSNNIKPLAEIASALGAELSTQDPKYEAEKLCSKIRELKQLKNVSQAHKAPPSGFLHPKFDELDREIRTLQMTISGSPH